MLCPSLEFFFLNNRGFFLLSFAPFQVTSRVCLSSVSHSLEDFELQPETFLIFTTVRDRIVHSFGFFLLSIIKYYLKMKASALFTAALSAYVFSSGAEAQMLFGGSNSTNSTTNGTTLAPNGFLRGGMCNINLLKTLLTYE